jgi:hypothetical protein
MPGWKNIQTRRFYLLAQKVKWRCRKFLRQDIPLKGYQSQDFNEN